VFSLVAAMVLAGVFWMVVATTTTFVSATPVKGSPVAKRDLVKKHVHAQVPRDWEMLDIPLEDHHTISLQIGLKQANFDGLVKELYEVSDPAHPRYGKHLSQA
jgi:tripeptidyl-peptidase I